MSQPHPSTLFGLLTISKLPVQNWKNGGGTTREILRHPPQAGYESFDWRLSLAHVQTSGDFSRFPGIERHILLIEGEHMQLIHNEQRHALHPFQPYVFAGEDKVSCFLAQGPTQDLNLMVRRGRTQGRLQAWAGRDTPVQLEAGTHFLYAPRGGYTCQAGTASWALTAEQALIGSTSVSVSLQLTADHAAAPLVYAYIAPTE